MMLTFFTMGYKCSHPLCDGIYGVPKLPQSSGLHVFLAYKIPAQIWNRFLNMGGDICQMFWQSLSHRQSVFFQDAFNKTGLFLTNFAAQVADRF